MKIGFWLFAGIALSCASVRANDDWQPYDYLFGVANGVNPTDKTVFTENSVRVFFYCNSAYLNGQPAKDGFITLKTGDVLEGQGRSPSDGMLESIWNRFTVVAFMDSPRRATVTWDQYTLNINDGRKIVLVRERDLKSHLLLKVSMEKPRTQKIIISEKDTMKLIDVGIYLSTSVKNSDHRVVYWVPRLKEFYIDK